MDTLPIETLFLGILAIVPFVLATYGYVQLIKTWESQKEIECKDPTNGAPFFTPLIFAIPEIMPGWYGVAATYLATALLITLGNGKCFFVQNAWYRGFVGLVASFALVMATWGNGEHGFVVLGGTAFFMLVGRALAREAVSKQ